MFEMLSVTPCQNLSFPKNNLPKCLPLIACYSTILYRKSMKFGIHKILLRYYRYQVLFIIRPSILVSFGCVNDIIISVLITLFL